ncbi:MAG: exo-alpha-sialidase, partial [Planctomycetota bacterium]
DYVFSTTSYKTGSALLKIVPTGKGLEAKEIYFLSPKQFENHHGGVVLVDGYLYGGDGQNKGTPVCLDMKTGKILWKEKPVGKGSAAVVYADGHLYFRYQNGLMVLAEANPGRFNVKGTFNIPVKTKYSWPHPVILDGRLYLRDNDVLLCYDISLGEQSAKAGYSGKSAAGAGAGMEHAVVCSESGVFCGWPANNGVWIWDGREILVGFSHRPYVEKKGHNAGSPTRSVLARSLDGGVSWTLEDPDNFVGDGGTVTASPGGIDFSHPDFAMRLDKGDSIKFFISYDRGRKWEGPYGFGDLMTHPEFKGLENTARTDYIVNGRHDCFIFMSARKPGTGTRDRAFVARTTDGGRSFKFVSWINPEAVGTTRGAMPSTVRISKTKLVTALRRKYPGQWVDVFVSNDNGANWKFLSKVADTGGWNGNPPALARLKDGRLCCVYGNRSERKMLAKYSSDEGATWGPEIVLRDDYQVDSFDDPDLGYPRLVQRWDGKLVAMYYWATKERPHHHIAATIWDPGKIKAHWDIPVENVIVSHEPGRFAGWPANNGVWKWGNEILVGFHQADYVEKDCSHSLGGNGRNLLARSLDGGATWMVEDPENFAGDGGEAVASPGNINFAHPDFAMRIDTKQFFISYERGRRWQGPYTFPDFGIGRRLTARTDYIVNGRQDCHIFLSAKEPKVEAALQDRAFCCRTTDGGKTFQFVSWMTGEPLKIRSVMPSTARCSSTGLVSAMRRRLDVDISGPKKMRKCWIDVYQSKDNGHTWEFLSQVADTGSSNGNPPSLVRLRDGRICVTYAYRGICSAYRYRWEPQGIRARISEDNGKSWGQEIVLRDDARTWDIGYTRSVQRLDGKIVTMYYYTTEEIPEQHIAATIWDPDLVRG